VSQTKRKKAEPLPKVALFTSKPKPRKPERIENIDSPDPQEGLSKDQIERFGEEIEKYPIINPTKLGNPETKTELPLLAKVELGLIKGDKAIEALCKEIRVSEAEHTKSMEEYGKQNEALAKVCYDQQVDISKLQAKVREIDANELKAIKLAEKVVGENAKIKTEIEDLKLTCSKQIYWEQESKITALRERLEAIKQHLEQMPKENQSIYWTSICDDEIQDEFISHKFFTDLQKWYQELGVLLAHDEKTVPIGDCGDKEILKVESKSEGKK